jgi:hypothetical protein
MVMSNVLELDIVPSSTAATSLEVADAPARRLRFQDTPEAALEMARRLLHSPEDGSRVGTDAFECVFGLLGTPHRGFIVAEMEALLASATGTVNPAFVDTLARLSAILEYPVARRSSRQDRAIGTGRLDAFRRAMDRYTALAVSAGRRGTPRDRAVALVALIDGLATRRQVSGAGRRRLRQRGPPPRCHRSSTNCPRTRSTPCSPTGGDGSSAPRWCRCWNLCSSPGQAALHRCRTRP